MRRVTELRQAEVQQLDAGLGDENIRGLQITMRDPFLVRGVERIANLDRVLQRLIDRQRPLEGRALDVLHDEIIWADVVDLADIRMIQRGDRVGFPLESLTELRGRNLDRHIAFQAWIMGLVHFPHTSGSDC